MNKNILILIFIFLSLPVYSAGPVAEIKSRDWAFSGPFGKYDNRHYNVDFKFILRFVHLATH